MQNTSTHKNLFDKITPWSRALFEKLEVGELVKKFHAFYDTRMFIIVYTRPHHWKLF